MSFEKGKIDKDGCFWLYRGNRWVLQQCEMRDKYCGDYCAKFVVHMPLPEDGYWMEGSIDLRCGPKNTCYTFQVNQDPSQFEDKEFEPMFMDERTGLNVDKFKE